MSGQDVIWKFKLSPDPFVMLPKGAQLLSAGTQGDDLVLWARCDPTAKREARFVCVVPTGAPVPLAAEEFVGTAVMDGTELGSLVFHVWAASVPSAHAESENQKGAA